MKAILLAVILCGSAGLSWALQGATNIGYQGKLLNPSGTPLNGSYSMCFAVYPNQTGAGSGACPRAGNLWNETIAVVPVVNGVYAVQLGNVTPLPPSVFANSPTYLGVGIGADNEMAPLQLLSGAPFTYSAAEVAVGGAAGINAGVAYATFTPVGNWQVPFGVAAASATFSSTVTVSGSDPGTGFSLQLSSGLTVPIGTVRANIVQASSGVFTAAGPTIFSLSTSSGVSVGGTGGVTAAWFSGNFIGPGVLNGGQKPAVPYWTGANALGNTGLDYDSAQSLTLLGSSLTVNGDFRQGAANSVLISSQAAAIAGGNGVFFSTVIFATATGNGYFSVVASSGIQVNAGALRVNGRGGIDATPTGILAATGTFTASGNTQYSLFTSSGISVGGTGGVTATWLSGTFIGPGMLSGGLKPAVPYWTASNALSYTGLDYDSAQSLTLLGSSLTVNGNLGQSAANSVLISSQATAISGSNGVFFSSVIYATATGNGYFSVVASSGIQVNAGTLRVNGRGGIDATPTGILAATGTFTASGNTQYSLLTSSGISVGGTGGVTATWLAGTFIGPGMLSGGQQPAVPYWTGNNTLSYTGLDYDSAQSLTLSGSSLTVNGNLRQSAANSVLISSQVAAITGSNGVFFSTVVYATATGSGYYGLVASSGIQVYAGTLRVSGLGGVDASATGILAATGTFTASGNTQYSLFTSSGISVGGTGGVTAPWFFGNFIGAALLSGGQSPAVPYWTGNNSLSYTSLDYDSAQSLTVFGSSLTVYGNLGQSAVNSVLISSQVAAIAGSNGVFFSTVVYATATGNGYYSLVASSGIQVNAGTLRVSSLGGVDASATGILAATATFIASGNNQFSLYTSSGIQMNGGTLRILGNLDATSQQVLAATGTFAVAVSTGVNGFSIVTSSGIQVNAGTLNLTNSMGIDASGTGIRATTATFMASGNTQYSLYTSSGISVGGTGGVTASWFSGSPAALTNVGTLNAVRVYTANATWTRATAAGAGVSALFVQVIGGGGGGGAVSVATSGNASVAGSGGAGGYAEAWLALPGADVTVTVSTGANGGAAGANPGTSAAPTSFGATVVASGGVGGAVGMAGGNSIAFAAPGSGGIGTTGDYLLAGSTGTYSQRINGTVGLSGDGGAAPYGGGGAVGVPVPAAGSATAGNIARNYGGGGSGASGAANSGVARTAAGGKGAGGLVLVWEFK